MNCRCSRSIVGWALETPRTSARVAKPPPASWSRTTSPFWKLSVVITRAPPRLTLSATVSSSCSTAPHSSTSWIVKFTKTSVRPLERRSFEDRVVGPVGWNSRAGASAFGSTGMPARPLGIVDGAVIAGGV